MWVSNIYIIILYLLLLLKGLLADSPTDNIAQTGELDFFREYNSLYYVVILINVSLFQSVSFVGKDNTNFIMCFYSNHNIRTLLQSPVSQKLFVSKI